MFVRPYHYTDIVRFLGRYQECLDLRRWQDRAQEWGRVHRVRLTLEVLQSIYPQLRVRELCQALPGNSVPDIMIRTALSYLTRGQVESSKVLTMASRSKKPRLWLSSYDLRQKYKLPQGIRPSLLLRCYDWFQRLRGWGRDFLIEKTRSSVRQEVQCQRHLNAWLDSGLQQSSGQT